MNDNKAGSRRIYERPDQIGVDFSIIASQLIRRESSWDTKESLTMQSLSSMTILIVGRNTRPAPRRLLSALPTLSVLPSASLSSSHKVRAPPSLIVGPTASGRAMTTSLKNGITISQQHRRRPQIQQFLQMRHYFYIPVEWPEMKERFIRWVEKTERRVVKVKLLSRKFMRRRKTEDIADIDDNVAAAVASPSSSSPAATVAPTSVVTPPLTSRSRSCFAVARKELREKKWKWKRWKLMTRKQRIKAGRASRLMTKRIANAPITIQPILLSSPPQVSASSPSSLRSRTRSNMEDIRNRYLRWKARKTVDFRAWEARRREQYVGWKQRRKDQVERWNDRRHRVMVRTRQILLEEYSRPEWFCSLSGRPLTSRDSTGRFVNPWSSQSTNGVHSLGTILKWRWQRFERELNQVGVIGLLTPTSIMPWLSASSSSLTQPATDSPLVSQSVRPLPTPTDSSLQCTWLGHATYLLHFDEAFTVLVDPVFSVRASPFQNSPIGVARDVPPSCTIQELVEHQLKNSRSMNGSAPHDQVRGVGSTINHQLRRPIDLCCVTHDHYDHLDRNSVLQLKDHVDVWITPLAVGDWLVEKCGIDRHRIVQLEWWEQIHLRKKQNGVEESPVEIVTQRCMENQHGGDGYSHRIIDGTESAKKEDIDGGGDSYKDLTITCCPASHWASRTLWDRNRRLWCSFALKTASYNFFACGDTSYPESFPLFRQIGDALGPFDLAALPIGAYGTRRQ